MSCYNSCRSWDRYRNAGPFQMRYTCLLQCPCQIPVQELYWPNFITCNFKHLSQAFVDRPFSECAPDLGLLPQCEGWRSGEAGSFCPSGPSCTFVSEIRQVGNRRSASSGHAPVWVLPQLLGWERWPRRLCQTRSRQRRAPGFCAHRAHVAELAFRLHSSCCSVLVSLEGSVNVAFIWVSPPSSQFREQ